MPQAPPREYIEKLVRLELETDIGAGDVTSSSVLPEGARAEGVVLAKAEGVVAGMPFAEATFRLLSEDVAFEPLVFDGARVKPHDVLARVRGPARMVLAAERTALNFLCHLSGVATLTRRFVDAVAGTKAKVLDTRKTLPGLRPAQKYAVRCGGGENHRMGLFDMILVKDNHIAAAGGIEKALDALFGRGKPELPVEVEVASLGELEVALRYPVDRIMLDNFSPRQVEEALALRERLGKDVPFECSGGITLENVRAYAETGVEYISIGALTHSAPQLDISLELRIS